MCTLRSLRKEHRLTIVVLSTMWNKVQGNGLPPEREPLPLGIIHHETCDGDSCHVKWGFGEMNCDSFGP